MIGMRSITLRGVDRVAELYQDLITYLGFLSDKWVMFIYQNSFICILLFDVYSDHYAIVIQEDFIYM